MIKIFTPSFADIENTNAQNLTVKQIVRRLDPSLFHVTMYYSNSIVDYLESRPNTKFIHWGKHWNAVKFIWNHIKSNYDIYFYPRDDNLSYFFLYLMNFKNKTKLITHIVHAVSEKSKENRILCDLINKSHSIYGNSNYVTDMLEKYFSVEANCIHNGIDTDFFYNNYNSNEKSIDVLYVGSFQKRKRTWILIDLAEKFPNLKISLVGDGPMYNDLVLRSKYRNIKNINFLGHLSQSQVGNIMRDSKIFLFPSIHEGHPQVIGQAIACGLPVIAMDCIKPDYIQHRFNGFLVKNDNDIFKYISQLLSDKKTYSMMSENSMLLSKDFNWDDSSRLWKFFFIEAMK